MASRAIVVVTAWAVVSATVPWVIPLEPAAPLASQAYYNTSLWSWGGSVVQDDAKLYHLYAASFVNHCGLNAWETNSQVHHGVSASPIGPFNFSDVAIPVWHHNPQAIRHPDGTYLIYTIGMDPEGKVKTCAAGDEDSGYVPTARGATAHGAEVIELHYSSSPYGPWTELIVPGAPNQGRNLFGGTNPTPWVLPNGTVIGAWRLRSYAEW